MSACDGPWTSHVKQCNEMPNLQSLQLIRLLMIYIYIYILSIDNICYGFSIMAGFPLMHLLGKIS